MHLFRRFAAAVTLSTALFTVSCAATQTPTDADAMKEGISTRTVNDITVTAIQDRPGEMEIGLFSGPATDAERKALVPTGKAPAGINVFVIKSGGKTILVDSGWGTALPGTSNLLPRLAELGITPDSIDIVLLTHMHGDHVGGLVSAAQAVFPRATLLAAKQEKSYWLSNKRTGKNPTVSLARGVRSAYGDRFKTFATGDTVAPGVTAVAAFGHTPGHTAFLVQSGDEKLLIMGDLIHAAALQFPKPDECAKYDMNPAKAVKSRKALLTRAAKENIPVTGMHLPFPPVGSVTANEDGSFTFTAQ